MQSCLVCTVPSKVRCLSVRCLLLAVANVLKSLFVAFSLSPLQLAGSAVIRGTWSFPALRPMAVLDGVLLKIYFAFTWAEVSLEFSVYFVWFKRWIPKLLFVVSVLFGSLSKLPDATVGG